MGHAGQNIFVIKLYDKETEIGGSLWRLSGHVKGMFNPFSLV